jgi:hypothetical protein
VVDQELAAMKLTSSLDQAIEAMKLLANLAWAHYNALRAAGFKHADAMTLTAAWQAETVRNTKKADG